jgi:hypothetical protein
LSDRDAIGARIPRNGGNESDELAAYDVERGVRVGDQIGECVVVSRSSHGGFFLLLGSEKLKVKTES